MASDKTRFEETVSVSAPEKRSGFVRKRVRHYFPVEEKRTKSHFKNECDINVIVNRGKKAGGILPDLIRQDGRYGDFTDVPSYHDSMGRVSLAKQQFEALSARLRARFNHDPGEFLAFANDPANGEEMVKLGLATPKAEPVDGDAVLADKIGTAVAKHTTKKAPKAPKGDDGEQA